MRERFKALTEPQRVAASTRARVLLGQQRLWRDARSVLFFDPLKAELDIWPLVAEALGAGKIAALPRFISQTGTYTACPIRDLAQDLEIGRFGIREPVGRCAATPLNKLDLILVPGIAFDLHGR